MIAYSDLQIKNKLKELEIICDTREQKNAHIKTYFDRNGIKYRNEKLDTGDYSVSLNEENFDKDILIERKASLSELAGNVTKGRKRFEKEFLRAKKHNSNVYLLIENSNWEEIDDHNYWSSLTPKAFKNTLISWQLKYDIKIIFINSKNSGEMIFRILYFYLRNKLKGE